MLQKGFTLIELMIVVAIIGILSMFALPAYQDYTKRTYVAEGMALASGAKLAATEYFSTQGEWPADNKAAGIADKITGQSVTDIQITADKTNKATPSGGIITITYGPKVATGAKLKLVSTGTTGGAIEWACSGTKATGTGTATAGNLEVKWLPNNCRDKS